MGRAQASIVTRYDRTVQSFQPAVALASLLMDSSHPRRTVVRLYRRAGPPSTGTR